MVVTRRKFAWALILIPATIDSTYRRASSNGARLGPAFLTHTIAFIENGYAASKHRRHQGRRYIAKLTRTFDNRRYQQVFGTRVQGALKNVDVAPQTPCRCVGQRGLSHSRLSQQPWVHGNIFIAHHQPGSEQLAHKFLLSHPFDGKHIRVGQVQSNAFNINGH